MNKKLSLVLVISFILQIISPLIMTEAFAASVLYPNRNYSDIGNHWGKEAIYEVSGLNYLSGTGNNKFSPNSDISYGEALTLMVRIANQDKDAQLKYPNNWMKGVYEVSEKLKLIERPEDLDIDEDILYPSPDKKVTREEFAYMFGRLFTNTPPIGGEITQSLKFADYNSISDKSKPYVELLLQKGYISGDVQKNYRPKTNIKRSEVSQVIYNSLEDIIGKRNVKKFVGEVTNKELGKLNIYNTDLSSNIFSYDGVDNFPVYKNGNVYTADVLEINDSIIYYVDKDNKPIYGKILSSRENVVDGTIENIDFNNRKIVVLDFKNNKHEYTIDPYLSMKNLYFGQEVIIKSKAGIVTDLKTIEAEDPERDGYIEPGSRFKRGTILFVNSEDIEILNGSKREKYSIDPFGTNVYKRGQQVNLSQIKEGDRVVLTFDDIYSSNIADIKIEDEERYIEGIVRGKVKLVDEKSKEVTLGEAERYNHGQWIPVSNTMRLRLGNGSIYNGSKKINLSNLKKNKNQEVYVAYESPYGSNTISKMVLKSGPSMEYENKLSDVDYSKEQLVLDTNSFMYHEGTIVVKDNRLVDSLNLDKNQDVFLISDYKNGTKGAKFISIEGTSPMDDRIDGTTMMVYRGKLEDILDYKLIIGNNNYVDKTIISSNGFETNREKEELIFTEDTTIYDSELKKYIPVKAFKDSRYIDLIDVKDKDLRDRIKNGYYVNKSMYAAVKDMGDQKIILGLNLSPQEKPNSSISVQDNFITKGFVKKVNSNGTVEFERIMNYNYLSKKWERGASELIDLSQAVVIQNDKALTMEELGKIREKSSGYLVRKKDKAPGKTYILIIED